MSDEAEEYMENYSLSGEGVKLEVICFASLLYATLLHSCIDLIFTGRSTYEQEAIVIFDHSFWADTSSSHSQGKDMKICLSLLKLGVPRPVTGSLY
jgi:hypothetical protein